MELKLAKVELTSKPKSIKLDKIKAIIEKISGENYISLFNKLIKTPLKTEDTYFSPPEKIKKRIS